VIVLALPATAGAATRPDLRIKSMSAGSGSALPGAEVRVGETTVNKGRRAAKRSTTAYFLSRGSRRTKIGSRSVPALRPGKSSKKVRTVVIPVATTSGSYFIVACADAGKMVRESNERNNCRRSSTQVTVAAPNGKLPAPPDGEANPNPPVIGGCQVYPADNEWNRDISGAEVDPLSDAYVRYSGSSVGEDWNLRQDWGDADGMEFGIPFDVVPQNQPLLPIAYGVDGEDYSDESDPGPYPFPADIRIEGDASRGGNPGDGDRHAIALRQGDCQLFETFTTTRTSDPAGFRVTSSAHFDLTSNATRPQTWTSADAAGLAIFPGLAKFEEIATGQLNHALRFTVPKVQNAWQAPATHYGTQSNACYPPYGARVRLKAGFDLSAFSGQALVIATALKKYGLMLADQGSAGFISGTSDAGWDIENLRQLRGIHGSDLEFVVPRGEVTRRFTPPADPAC
jgi:hypothetical protein